MPLPPIVSLDEIRDRLAEIVICDVRWYLDGRSGEAAYRAGHIPRSLFVDLEHDLSDPELAPGRGRHPMPSAELFAQRLGALGISETDTIVAYDDSAGTIAGRFVWMLRSTGHDAALLDGGLQAWDGELESTQVRREPVSHAAIKWEEGLLVTAEQVAQSLQLSSARVFDVRSPSRYRGESEPVDARPGHVPGAVSLHLGGNTDGSGFFLSKSRLVERFIQAGVVGQASPASTDPASTDPASTDPASTDPAIVYCGSGVSACQTLLAIEHAGMGRMRLFPGSWSEWSHDPARPVATGDEP